MAANDRSIKGSWLIVFSTSLGAIFLQLIQTRVYSVLYFNHLVYFVISLALLGYGISGTWLSLGEKNFLNNVLTLPLAAFGFLISTILAFTVIPRFEFAQNSIFCEAGQLIELLLTYCFSILPYFFAGWILGCMYRDNALIVHNLYFADLIGASSGCFAFLYLITPFGVINCILLICTIIVFPIIFFRTFKIKRVFFLILLISLISGIFWKSDFFENSIIPEPNKSFTSAYKNLLPNDEKVVEVSEWNPISRIDVVSTKLRPKLKRIYIDGDADTGIVANPPTIPPPFHSDKENMLFTGAPYLLHKKPQDVLVIGVGGGWDVWDALRAGSINIDAVEINSTTAKFMKFNYRNFTNDLLWRPNVKFYVEEGRSFVRRSSKHYDVIVLHVIDTLTALSNGAYLLSENYLYTVEGFKDYLTHLKPGGTLCITRWEYGAEGFRLFGLGLEALHELKVSQPELCLISFSHKHNTLMVRKTPFKDEEVKMVMSHLQRIKNESDSKQQIAFNYPLPGLELTPSQFLYRQIVNKRANGTISEVYSKMESDHIFPVYDDNPFFFHYENPWSCFEALKEGQVLDLIRGHWASFTLYILLILTSLAVFLFIFIPLYKYGNKILPQFYSWLVFFCSLGVSFIFVEIALIQRFVLLLGHPVRSISFVLGGLLFSAGLGSLFISKYSEKSNFYLPFIIGLIVLGVLGVTFILPKLTFMALGWSLLARELLTLVCVASLGFFMGMPFPSGLKLVGKSSKEAIPWMWGVNGGLTVVGSILAIIIAIQTNFSTVLVCAAVGYFVALAVCVRSFSK